MSQKSLLILTGHSKGLGRAVLDAYLQHGGFEIIGISRTKLGLGNPNLTEISIDFGEIDLLETELPKLFPSGDYREIILINNAGLIGEIKPVGKLQFDSLRTQVNVNLLAPMYLTNAFVSAFRNSTARRIICNISSGAASKPVEGWAGYCSTKAALAMFTQIAAKENNNIRFFSVAPGIVDTLMQGEIRQADGSDFPQIDRFKSYKENGELSTPESVAAKIKYMLENESEFEEVIQDVRSFELPM
ncbi:benzil reductase ((S)-benzoin forming) [Algoriphagus sp. 4150]|uniref:SDR family NAD(P)-dependent oxidoreductase n=1 Tax=Algoriphagus sp. 4150 TaxID=2817756 RepID=UPI0028605033|nr:SDR family NAD(P)-dependent oxidoreductase [Algoriphagus sp. 4150]MDR7130000.1 benzil reductase ((S)-benzoin forming) [Algoriphagus sp. 4150]